MLYINQLRFIAVYEQLYASILVISFIYVKTMSWSYTCWHLLHFLSVYNKSVLTKIFDYLAWASILELLFRHGSLVIGKDNWGKAEFDAVRRTGTLKSRNDPTHRKDKFDGFQDHDELSIHSNSSSINSNSTYDRFRKDITENQWFFDEKVKSRKRRRRQVVALPWRS